MKKQLIFLALLCSVSGLWATGEHGRVSNDNAWANIPTAQKNRFWLSSDSEVEAVWLKSGKEFLLFRQDGLDQRHVYTVIFPDKEVITLRDGGVGVLLHETEYAKAPYPQTLDEFYNGFYEKIKKEKKEKEKRRSRKRPCIVEHSSIGLTAALGLPMMSKQSVMRSEESVKSGFLVIRRV